MYVVSACAQLHHFDQSHPFSSVCMLPASVPLGILRKGTLTLRLQISNMGSEDYYH